MVKFIKSIYDWGINVLLSSPFKWTYLVLSHGFFHIILLIIVGYLALHFYTRNQDKLKDTVKHTIWVKVDALSRQSDKYGQKNYIDMNTYFLELTLNSDSIEKKTNGKYRDALWMNIIPPTIEENSLILPACSDTIKIGLLRQPYKSDVMVAIDDLHPKDSNNMHILESSPKDPISYKDSAGVCVFNTTLTNMAKIPVVGQWIKGSSLTIYSNDFSVGKSPYYLYDIKFDIPDPEYLDTLLNWNLQYHFAIVLDDSKSYSKEFGSYSKKQILMHNIEPKPDYIISNYICYNTKESIENIRKNNGITLYAEDLIASNKNKQEEFLNSVLTGTCLAFMLDILVQLVIKLRRLHQTRKRKEIKKSDQGSTTD